MKIIGIQGARGSFCEEAAEVFAKNHGVEKYKIDFLISSDAGGVLVTNVKDLSSNIVMCTGTIVPS